MQDGLTLELGRFISGLRYADIPPLALVPIRTAFVDTLGVAIAGAREPAVALLHGMLSPPGGESLLLGGLGRASALDAAWINGTAAHALDFDDVSQRGFGHASASLVPAILAEAQACGADGSRMLAAYAAGYETIAELTRRDADAGRYHDKGWHPTGPFGAIAAAAACASLRQLDARQCAMVLSLAGSQASGLVANVGTMTKPFHVGRAAHAGVASARLVAAGFSAAIDALEHPPGFLCAFSFGGRIDVSSPSTAGKDWQICGANQISVKKYPMCFCTHRAIDGMLDLLATHHIESAEVEAMELSLSRRNMVILRNQMPRNGLEAKFSAEFALVAPLVARRLGLTELQDAFVQRPDVQSLMRRVRVVPDDRDHPQRPGYAVHDRIRITLGDGSVLDSGPITGVRGDHDSPLRDGELQAKLEDCLRSCGSRVPPAQLYERLMQLDAMKDSTALFRLLEEAR